MGKKIMANLPKKPKYKYYGIWGAERKPRYIGVAEGERVYNQISKGFMKGKSSCKQLWKIRSELTAVQARKLINMEKGKKLLKLRGTTVGKKLIDKGKVL